MNAVIDRSAPGIRITALSDEKAVEGAPLNLDGKVLSMTMEDNDKKADKLTLLLDNFDLSAFENDALMGGAILDVSWGYPAHMSPPRRIIVKNVKGFQQLNIEGHALSSQMNRERKSRVFSNVTRSHVAKAIAAEYGYFERFQFIEDTEEVYDTINQSGETDARLLRRLASKEAFIFYIDHTGFHWHARKFDGVPTHVFTYYSDPGRGDILSVSIESNLIKRVGKVVVKGRDPISKETIESSESDASAARTILGNRIEVVDPETGKTSLESRNATKSVHATSASNKKRASRQAAARYRRAAQSTLKLNVRVVGDPTITAKRVIELRGLPPFLSGKYYVKSVKHVISSSGYICELKLTRDGVGKRGRTQKGDKNNNAKNDKPIQVEVVDPETGETRIEYRKIK